MKKTDLVILAGGRGSRIKNYLNGQPKPLVKINNYRFLDLLIRKLCKYNLNKLYILAGYKGNLIKKRYHNKKFNFIKSQVIIEKKPLGTAGCLSQLKKKIKNDFILVNGDTFFDLDLSRVINYKLNKKEILLSLVNNSNYKSNKKLVFLKLNKNKKVSFNNNSNLINGGVYKFDRSFLQRVYKKNYSLENDIIPSLINKRLVNGLKFKNFFIDIGTPKNLTSAKNDLISYLKKPALFLDRDNTIIYDNGYVHQLKNLKLKISFIKTLKKIASKDIYIFIVTNQSGIGRGFFTVEQFEKFHIELKKKLSVNNIHIDEVQYCPYLKNAKIKKYRKKTNLRKPGNGMILNLFNKWPINKKKSIMIGDQISDQLCAKKSGIDFLFTKSKNIKNLFKRFT